jgi:hypothetical protein
VERRNERLDEGGPMNLNFQTVNSLENCGVAHRDRDSAKRRWRA